MKMIRVQAPSNADSLSDYSVPPAHRVRGGQGGCSCHLEVVIHIGVLPAVGDQRPRIGQQMKGITSLCMTVAEIFKLFLK